MQVRFFLGRANTGKSREIRRRMAQHQRAGETAVLIVPEQYTFEAERMLASEAGGLLGVQVLSFDRLNERLLALHGRTLPYLSAQGHRMVVRRAALKNLDRLTVFRRAAQRSGFALEMQQAFTDFKRAGVTPEMLLGFAKKLPEGAALCAKLNDMALIYQDTEAFLSERYLTMDDAANAARALLPNSFVKGAHVYLDGVDRPSAQFYSWLVALVGAAASVTIALRYDDAASGDGALFLPDMTMYSRIRAMAAQLGAPVTARRFDACESGVARELNYLEKNLFAPCAAPYEDDAPAITLFGATDRASEAEALGDRILEAARGGMRYAEMAVIVSDPEAYLPLVERAFAARSIPAFVDRKRPVTGHAAVDAVLSALRAAESGFAVPEVLRLAKSGYAGVSLAQSEALELYLLRTGLVGGMLSKPFARGEVPPEAEEARAIIMGPLIKLQKALAAKQVFAKVEALYDYLVALGLDGALRLRAEALQREGRIALSQEHAQVWNTLMEALSQLHAIMGDVAVSRKVFVQLLEEGLTGCEIGVIPGTSDQVLVGDLARTKSRAVKALFLVGVNDGLLPRARYDDGIIDEHELHMLAQTGMPVWSGVKQRGAEDRLELYTALTKGRRTLYVSHCFSSDGMELAPSPLVNDLKRLFPRCRVQTSLDPADSLPSCERAGLAALTSDLCALHTDDKITPRLPTYLSYFAARPAYAARVRRMAQARQARYAPPPLGRALGGALYGKKIVMSASRLEQFAACPFKHFIRYGLAAAERKEFTERATDLGTFYHAVLEAFVRRVIERGGDWRALDDAAADSLIDELLPSIIAAHNGGVYVHNERLRATLFLLIESVKMSARAIVHQVQCGDATPLGAELRFGEGQAFPPVLLKLEDGTEAYLSGVIDRVDRLKPRARGAERAGVSAEDAMIPPNENSVLRVIDYKLSDREFDFAGVLAGLTLQLPLYLSAVTQQGNVPGGMYYMPLATPVADEDESLERAAVRAFRLRGLTLNDPAIIHASDHGAAEGEPQVLKNIKCAGEGAFSGSVCTPGEMARLLDHARRVAERALKDMLDGHMEVRPVEGACNYCDYRSVCRFDPMVRGCRTRKRVKLKQEAFFAGLGGDET